MMWMRAPALQKVFGRGRMLLMSIGMLARAELLVMSGHKEKETLRLIRRTRRERNLLVTANEAFLLHSLARAQRALEGDMAELGVFQGASARLLCDVKGPRTLHLFDTFDGLPEPDRQKDAALHPHQFRAGLRSVQTYLADYSDVRFHPGRFPHSAVGLEHMRFSFVHLDADLYDSIRAGLEFFVQRLVPQGVVLCHDYSILPGVKAAVDEYAAAHPVRIVELPTTQALVLPAAAAHG